jgi:hypothetical protein
MKLRKTKGKRRPDGSRATGKAVLRLAARVKKWEETTGAGQAVKDAYKKPGRGY